MKEYITWEFIMDYINSIIEKTKNKKFSGVYGLPRGGLILAVLLSHKLDIPLLMAPTKNCIIIDDILDSGESLLHYMKNSSNPNNSNNYYITTMFFKKNYLNLKPDYYFLEKENKWIVFPWEND